MKLGPIMILAVVAVFGAAAVFTAQHFLQGQSPQANRAPQVVASQVEMKTVVVAVRPLHFGAELTPEHLREVEWPASATPIGAFNSISELLTDEGRRVVLSPIEESEPVLSWKVTGPGERATLSAVVEDGMRAMSVRINDVLGVAGFVLPGDRVDVLLTRDGYTDILLQNVEILAIDQTGDERHDKPTTATTAILEVNSVDAQKLTLAQTEGSLSLALRAAGPAKSAAPRRIKLKELGPAYEIYAEDKNGEAEETPVDLRAKDIESGFRAMEERIEKMGEDFTRKIQPINTEAFRFDPNARGDFPNDPVKCDFPYGPCQKRLKPAHKWFEPR
jgi:pilus assembly protein CpaB